MLKKIRVVLAVTVLFFLTFFLVDFAGLLPSGFKQLTQIQLVPALLALNGLVIAFLLLLTLLFGRVYCSVICPLGIFQDVVARISRVFHKKKKERYRPPRNVLRYVLLGTILIAFFSGFAFLLVLTDPYSIYARGTIHLFKPAYLAGNNLLTRISEALGNYRFYHLDPAPSGLPVLAIAFVSLLLVSWLAWKYSRLYCNTICPVGTLLGTLSRYSLFKIRFREDSCNGCGLCAKHCKSSCIDSQTHTVDHSRCVVCFDCLEACQKKAVSYTYRNTKTKPAPDKSRRTFLLTTGLSMAALPQAKARQIEAALTGRKAIKKEHPLSPPGAVSTSRLLRHCTGCHLCVSKCPSRVLVPAIGEYGASGMLMPRMSFEKGFCNFSCTACSEICPAGALLPLTKEEKHTTQVGQAIFIIDNCIVYTNGTSCGACSEHCPTQAVSMTPYRDGLTIPVTHPDLCIGCGGCEYVCPARPFKAIYVEGLPVHRRALPIRESAAEEAPDDFGF